MTDILWFDCVFRIEGDDSLESKLIYFEVTLGYDIFLICVGKWKAISFFCLVKDAWSGLAIELNCVESSVFNWEVLLVLEFALWSTMSLSELKAEILIIFFLLTARLLKLWKWPFFGVLEDGLSYKIFASLWLKLFW